MVYRARDRNLDRPVALKVLHHDEASREGVLPRFGREAKILASIRSPNIASIYGYEAAGDMHVLVLELVEGLTLRQRLEQGPLPLREVLAIGGDIAAALQSAHDLGIIHCDLKPENVKITPDGVVKILDFGIATRMAASSGRASQAQMPAASLGAPDRQRSSQAGSTEERSNPGALVGTPPYMAPEQVLHEPLSSRTDNWAFGCLVFECLAGQSPFARRTLPETLMAVVGGEPDWMLLPRETPQQLRRLLQRCLEKDPATRLSDLSDLRIGFQAIALETSPERPAAAKLPRHNLPTGRTSYIGRTQEATHTAAVLTATRLVTLIGPGGFGKTRLVTEVGFQLLETFADGVWLIEVADVLDPPSLPHVVAGGLGLSADSVGDLVRALRTKEMLLILDAGEQALSGWADLASRLLSDCPKLSILAVGTEGMGVVGEATYAVRPLAWPVSPTSLTLAEAHGIESVALFVERARSFQPHFTLTEETAPAVVDVCRLLCGVPLAIELAAAQVKLLPVAQLAQRLRQELAPPTRSRPTTREFGEVARAVIEWAIRQVSDDEMTLLRRLAVFANSWTMEAARAVCEGDGVEDVFDVLARLTELSFVFVESRGGQTRYRMSNAIRARAGELLRASGEHEVMCGRHSEFFLKLADRAERRLAARGHPMWHTQPQTDAANLRAAFAFAEQGGEGEKPWARYDSVQQEILFRRLAVFQGGWTLAAAEAICGDDEVEGIAELLDQLVDRRLVIASGPDGERRYAMAARVRRHARERLAASEEAAELRCRHHAFFLQLAEEAHAGLFGPEEAVWVRRLEADHANLLEAIGSCEDSGEADASLCLIAALSRFWEIGGHLEEGRRLAERALGEFGAAADPVVTARALVGAARLAVRAGDLAAAQAQLERAHQLCRTADRRAGVAEVLEVQATVAVRRGNYHLARALGDESLSMYRDLGDERGAAWSLLTLAEVAYRDGDYAGSRDLRERALALFRTIHDQHGLAWALNNLGKIALRQGDAATAHAYHAESLALHRALGDQAGTAWSLSLLAHVAFAAGDAAGARVLLEEGLVLSKQGGNQNGVAWSLVHLANVAYHEEELRTATSLLMEGLALFRQMHADGGSAWCLVGMGNVARRRGKSRSAHVLLAQSLVAFTGLGEKRGVASALRGLSLLAVGEPHKATRLLAAAEALRDEMGERLIPPEQRELDAHLEDLRHRLGGAAFAAAREQGRASSPKETVSLALRWSANQEDGQEFERGRIELATQER